MSKLSEKSLDQKARRAAKRAELCARKSRWRLGTIDNEGGFRITDPYTNFVVAGEKWDLSAHDVIEYCQD